MGSNTTLLISTLELLIKGWLLLVAAYTAGVCGLSFLKIAVYGIKRIGPNKTDSSTETLFCCLLLMGSALICVACLMLLVQDHDTNMIYTFLRHL